MQPTAIDPVCHMKVDPEHPRGGSLEHAGQTFYFCNPRCRERFAAEPGRYLGARSEPQAQATKGAAWVCPMDPDVRRVGPGACPKCGMALEPELPLPERNRYVCPMHPEIVRDQPGSCPICGMALEPRSSGVEPGNPELIAMQRRLVVGAALSVPLMLIANYDLLSGAPLVSPQISAWLQLGLATPVVFWGGWPFFQRGWLSIVSRHLNMFTLIALGCAAAYGFSVAVTLAPGLSPDLAAHGGGLPVYYEAAAVIVTLALLGQVLELRARSATSGALRALLGLRPKTARVIAPDGEESDRPIEAIQPGQQLRVRPGERVPLDGVVVEGASAIDEASITGEPLPVHKQAGDKVTGGTQNTDGSFVMRVERIGADTLLAQIVALVSEAQRSRAPIQRLADAVSAWFVPTVVVIAALSGLFWLKYGPEPQVAYALVNAVAVLIIACPCALGLATPMSIMVGTGRAARAGILVKNAEALELFERVDTIVFDKTGTLTEGRPRFATLLPASELEPAVVLAHAAALEKASEHPLARAILAEAAAQRLELPDVQEFQSHSGLGVSGQVAGRTVVLGSARLLESRAIALGSLAQQGERLREQGQIVVFVAIDGRPAGLIGVIDPIKPSSASALDALRRDGLRLMMLTGDSQRTAQRVARELRIDELQAELLPDQKIAVIQRLKAQGRIVAMVGDGINDAPALAAAHVGIAIGTGTDIAIESASLALLQSDLRGLVRARNLSRAVMRNIRQNLFFAFVYNALGVPVAAGVAYPFFGLLLSPMLASAAMAVSSVSVIANALRLRRLRL